VLDAVGAHPGNAQIAGRLHISVRTVESHVSSLLRRLGAADRRELAALAPAAGAPAAAVSLPGPWTSFVGRDREQAAVRAALREARLVKLVGPGGVGKTRRGAVASTPTSRASGTPGSRSSARMWYPARATSRPRSSPPRPGG
jgi:hypothetical protein